VKRYRAELWQDGMCVAAVDCPTEEAMRQEILHYALVYSQDGSVEIRIKEDKNEIHRHCRVAS
jgi:hypothetical protein